MILWLPSMQPELPFWLTSAGSVETFRQAGELGGGVLTHLLGQSAEELARKVTVYREAIADRHGRRGHVALMLHTFLGNSQPEVRSVVEQPFSDYLRSSLELQLRSSGMSAADINPADLDFMIRKSFDRYFVTSGLFGSVDDGLELLQTLRRFDIDEVACLIDSSRIQRQSWLACRTLTSLGAHGRPCHASGGWLKQ